MSENKRNKAFINSADLIIIIAVLAIACGLFFRTPLEKIIEERFFSADITYEAVIYGKEASFLDIIEPGATIYDTKSNEIGVISKVSSEQSFILDNQNHLTEYFDIYLIIDTKGKTDAYGSYVGDSVFVAPGTTMKVFTSDNVTFDFTVKRVETYK